MGEALVSRIARSISLSVFTGGSPLPTATKGGMRMAVIKVKFEGELSSSLSFGRERIDKRQGAPRSALIVHRFGFFIRKNS